MSNLADLSHPADFYRPVDFYRNLPTLTTPRLILRPLCATDAADYYVFASDPQVVQYLCWGPHASLEQTQAYLAEVLLGYAQGTDGPWGIEHIQDQRLIGATHLMALDFSQRTAEVGVVIGRGCWEQGLGSEALNQVVAHCFQALGLNRITAKVVVGNRPACRMLEKCGFINEGSLPHHAFQKGQWLDFELYGLESGYRSG